MKWKSPKYRGQRVKKKFLFLPLEIKGEVRWLEFATIKQEYNEWHVRWENKEWL